MKRPIAIGLAPNISAKDAFAALHVIFNPFRYTAHDHTTILERWFQQYFKRKYATAFTSGRGSIYAILTGLGIGKGDEVIVQSFTCAAVIQAVMTAGATPVYADITDSLTFSVDDVRKRITKKTKAIILQYTFGIPGEIDALQSIAKKNKIALIEDAAHTIGGTYNKKRLGTFGVASIVSFGRDKAFSCVSGGVAMTDDVKLGEYISVLAEKNQYPSRFWIFQQILHTVAFYFFILPTYNFFIGKLFLVLLQKLHLLSLPVDVKRTKLSDEEIKKLPPVLSYLALIQLERIEIVNQRRLEIASIYEKELSPFQHLRVPLHTPLLRYPLTHGKADEVISYFRKNNIYLGSWYGNIIDPKGISYADLGYKKGSNPHAEGIASHIINLPTYATLTDKEVYTICRLFKSYAAH